LSAILVVTKLIKRPPTFGDSFRDPECQKTSFLSAILVVTYSLPKDLLFVGNACGDQAHQKPPL
jgi:hypothetical protein